MRFIVMGKAERAAHTGKGAQRALTVTLTDSLAPAGEVTLLVDQVVWDQLALGDEVEVIVMPTGRPKLHAVPPPPEGA